MLTYAEVGLMIKPALEWKEMLAILKDKIEPKGRDRVFEYAKGPVRQLVC
jgi:hypothetical protein